VETLLEFAQGPLFRLTFALMVLGLIRIFILDIWGIAEAYRKAGDKAVPWGQAVARTIQWLFPVKRVLHHRPIYSVVAILFHIGLLVTPIFLFAHVELWKSGLGVGWITLPQTWANWLTLAAIILGVLLFLGRIGSSNARILSRKQDYLWPLLLIIPFITGYVCANMSISPASYQLFMLLHVLSGELIFVLLPFTKIAHCVLMPLSQFVSVIAWKFPASVDDDVCTTLGKKGAKV
jgi:nitrate reductase gamma subunit